MYVPIDKLCCCLRSRQRTWSEASRSAPSKIPPAVFCCCPVVVICGSRDASLVAPAPRPPRLRPNYPNDLTYRCTVVLSSHDVLLRPRGHCSKQRERRSSDRNAPHPLPEPAYPRYRQQRCGYIRGCVVAAPSRSIIAAASAVEPWRRQSFSVQYSTTIRIATY